MRRLILRMNCSLDGCVAAANGDLEWIFPGIDPECERWAVAQLWDAGLHLMGSHTYGDMAAHWPTSGEPYAPPMNDIPKVVFSSTLKDATWPETRIVAGDLRTEIERLKREDGKDLLAHGGVGFARSLVRAGVVDEYRLFIHPIVVGDGPRIFDVDGPTRLQLVDAKVFERGIIATTLRPS